MSESCSFLLSRIIGWYLPLLSRCQQQQQQLQFHIGCYHHHHHRGGNVQARFIEASQQTRDIHTRRTWTQSLLSFGNQFMYSVQALSASCGLPPFEVPFLPIRYNYCYDRTINIESNLSLPPICSSSSNNNNSMSLNRVARMV